MCSSALWRYHNLKERNHPHCHEKLKSHRRTNSFHFFKLLCISFFCIHLHIRIMKDRWSCFCLTMHVESSCVTDVSDSLIISIFKENNSPLAHPVFIVHIHCLNISKGLVQSLQLEDGYSKDPKNFGITAHFHAMPSHKNKNVNSNEPS